MPLYAKSHWVMTSSIIGGTKSTIGECFSLYQIVLIVSMYPSYSKYLLNLMVKRISSGNVIHYISNKHTKHTWKIVELKILKDCMLLLWNIVLSWRLQARSVIVSHIGRTDGRNIILSHFLVSSFIFLDFALTSINLSLKVVSLNPSSSPQSLENPEICKCT